MIITDYGTPEYVWTISQYSISSQDVEQRAINIILLKAN